MKIRYNSGCIGFSCDTAIRLYLIEHTYIYSIKYWRIAVSHDLRYSFSEAFGSFRKLSKAFEIILSISNIKCMMKTSITFCDTSQTIMDKIFGTTPSPPLQC